MPQLANRNVAIPNGLVYRQPETGFKPPAWTSFSMQVTAVLAYRRANPFLAQQHKWALDPVTVANEIDVYLAQVCSDNGWTKYITGGTPQGGSALSEKKTPLSPRQRLAAVAAGAETLVDWLRDGAEAVPPAQAEARASVCVGCPQNGKGGFESYFTKPASEAIRQELERRRDMKLSTSLDEQIGVCEACLCPLKLKVHLPLPRILAGLPADAKARLDAACWILAEEKATT